MKVTTAKNKILACVSLLIMLALVSSNAVSANDRVNAATEFDHIKKLLPAAADYENIPQITGLLDEYAVPWTNPPAAYSDNDEAAPIPVISEYNKEVMPNESITFSGWDFTVYDSDKKGCDTTFWIWSGKNGGILKKMELLMVEHDTVVASIPKEMPVDMYMVWAENRNGICAPVFVNRARAQWVGPLGIYAEPGEVKRIFGRALTSTLADQRDDQTANALVFLKEKNGPNTYIECDIPKNLQPLNPGMSDDIYEVNPYCVSFTVPDTVNAGSTYEVYITNTMGGTYGLEAPEEIVIQKKFVIPNDKEHTIRLEPNGINDASQINEALWNISNWPQGGTLELGEGVFRADNPIFVIRNTRIIGQGEDKTRFEVNSHIRIGKVYIDDNENYDNFEFRNISFACVDDADMQLINFGTSNSTWGGRPNRNILIKSCSFLSGGYNAQISIGLGAQFVEVTQCTFEWVLSGTDTDWWVHNNDMRGYKAIYRQSSQGAMAFYSTNGNYEHEGIIIERNYTYTPKGMWPDEEQDKESQLSFANRLNNSRVFFFAAMDNTMENGYAARNLATDTAIYDNQGEMILFHVVGCDSYLNVANSTDTVITINTTPSNPVWLSEVPKKVAPNGQPQWTNIENTASVLIFSGKGQGQIRRLVARTDTTITVDRPFTLVPDETSVIWLGFPYLNQVVYKNQLSALPDTNKYDGHIASFGVDFDGCSIMSVADGNKSFNTKNGDTIIGSTLGSPSFWTELKNGQVDNMPDWAMSGTALNAVLSRQNDDKGNIRTSGGPAIFGCWVRNYTSTTGSSVSVFLPDGTKGSDYRKIIEGSGIENSKVTDKPNGYVYGDRNIAGFFTSPFTDAVIRNITFGVNFTKFRYEGLDGKLYQPPGMKMYTYPQENKTGEINPIIDNIKNEDGSSVIWDGAKDDDTPLVNFRSLHFVSSKDKNPKRQELDIKNYGLEYSDWFIDGVEYEGIGDFIKTAVNSNIFTHKNPIGKLTVGIDGTGLGNGKYFGVIRLKNHSGKTVSIGVNYYVDNEYDSVAEDVNSDFADKTESFTPPTSSASKQSSSASPASSASSKNPESSTGSVSSKNSTSSTLSSGYKTGNDDVLTDNDKNIVLLGSIVNENNEPVSNTPVKLDSIGFTHTTNGEGQFEFYNISHGFYSLKLADKSMDFNFELEFSSKTMFEDGILYVNSDDFRVMLDLKLENDGSISVVNASKSPEDITQTEEYNKKVNVENTFPNMLNVIIPICAGILGLSIIVFTILSLRKISKKKGAEDEK